MYPMFSPIILNSDIDITCMKAIFLSVECRDLPHKLSPKDVLQSNAAGFFRPYSARDDTQNFNYLCDCFMSKLMVPIRQVGA